MSDCGGWLGPPVPLEQRPFSRRRTTLLSRRAMCGAVHNVSYPQHPGTFKTGSTSRIDPKQNGVQTKQQCIPRSRFKINAIRAVVRKYETTVRLPRRISPERISA